MLNIPSLLLQRFQSLEEQARKIGSVHQGNDTFADPQQFYAWAGSALNAIHGAFGADAAHSITFQTELASVQNNLIWSRKLSAIVGIFLGAKSDVDGGYFFDLQRSISGELFGNIVALAKGALSEGHHTVAAVLACAALEDALKRYAAANDLDVTGKAMDEVVNALKSKGLVSGAQKALLGAMPRVRNHALHAEWDKITPQDAGSVLGFVEQFLLTNF
jgi:hypothetical protein